MQTIHKYPLNMGADTQSVEMPRGAVLRRVDFQHGTLTLWAQVDPGTPPETRTFTRYRFDPAIVDQRMEMPKGAVVHHAAIHGRGIAMWAEENPANPKAMREFTVRSTGQNLPEQGTFVATVMDPPFVWHIFEITAQPMQLEATPGSETDLTTRPKRYQFATGLQPLPARKPHPQALETTHRGKMTPEEFKDAFGQPGLVDAMCMETTDLNGFHLTLFVNHVSADENDDSHQIFLAQALLELEDRNVGDHRALTAFLKQQSELTPEAAEMLLLTADGGYSARDADMKHMAETAHERSIGAADYLNIQEMPD